MRPHSFGTASLINRQMPEIKRKKQPNIANAAVTGLAQAAPHAATGNWPMALLVGLGGAVEGAKAPKGEVDIAQAFGALPKIASARSEAAKKRTKKTKPIKSIKKPADSNPARSAAEERRLRWESANYEP